MNRRDLQLVDGLPNEEVRKNIKDHCVMVTQKNKDQKRTLKPKEKEIVWQDAEPVDGCDPNSIRLDIIGCVVIKYLRYSRNNPNNKFAFDYEHIAPHIIGGPTTPINNCLLISWFNMSKGPKPLYEISDETMKDVIKNHGVLPKDFLKEVTDNGIDYISKKYNLLFEYNEKNQIRPVVSGTTKSGKNIYAVFSENIEEAAKNIDWESGVKTVVITVIVIVGVVVVVTIIVGTTKFLCDQVPIWYEKLNFFIEENKRIKAEEKEYSKFADIICLKNNKKRSIFEKIGARYRDIFIGIFDQKK
jgi:hypothetical protein